jgi:hypothetical protein
MEKRTQNFAFPLVPLETLPWSVPWHSSVPLRVLAANVFTTWYEY